MDSEVGAAELSCRVIPERERRWRAAAGIDESIIRCCHGFLLADGAYGDALPPWACFKVHVFLADALALLVSGFVFTGSPCLSHPPVMVGDHGTVARFLSGLGWRDFGACP